MKRRQPPIYLEKKIIYGNRATIKLWNFNNDNIVDYFKKRFSSHLSEMGLSWHPFLHPKNHITVKNSQTKKIDFIIDINHNCCSGEEWRYLNFDINHLIFFDISDKEKEFRLLNQFNERIKPKNKSNEILHIDETNTEFFLNPNFFLILYDSTNESGNYHPPENCSIFLPSYSDLIIIGQKHFDIQGFYEWLYKSTYRKTRGVVQERNPEFTNSLKNLMKKMEKSPAYELNKTMTKIVSYNFNDKSSLSEILDYFSRKHLKKMSKKLNLTKISDRKDELINNLVEISTEINNRHLIIRMCIKYLQKEAQTLRSSKEAKDFASQLGNMLGSKNMVIHTKSKKK
jgi:hypothetical protein